VAIDDPHSDYAIQMEKVCRRAPSAFGKAVEGLPDVRRRFFVEHVMNPKNCRPLAVPEAEEQRSTAGGLSALPRRNR